MKALIQVSGKQYLVAEKETLLVDHLQEGSKELSLEPLMVMDEAGVRVGTPTVAGVIVKATIDEPEVKGKKVHVVHFESKKRVKNMRGHRQRHSRITISKIG